MIVGIDVDGHVTSENNITFYTKENVAKCPICDCFFFNSHDYQLHTKGGCRKLDSLPWRKSKEATNNEGGYKPSMDRQFITASYSVVIIKFCERFKNREFILVGHYKYFLSTNKKWLQREPIPGYVPKRNDEEDNPFAEEE